jgi:ABC-type nitrate/sulfonate/bicarbonate transport system substrate-binding protein
MRNSRLAAGIAASAIAIALAAAGCGGSSSRDDGSRPRVDVGYAFAYDAGDVGDQVAFARLRRRTAIEFRIRELGSVANAVVALVRGEVQLATVPYATAVRAAEEGAHLRVVLGANMSSELVLVGGGDVASVAELRRRRVAVEALGVDGEALVRRALARAGLSRSQVTLTALDKSAARADALAAGRVDAAVLEELDYVRLRVRHEPVSVLASFADLRPRSTETVWVVSQAYERTHRVLLQRIVDGLLDGYGFLYSRAGRRAWLAQARRSALDDDAPVVAKRVYAFYRRVGFWPVRDEPVTREQHLRTVRSWVASRQLDRVVPFSRVWDASFWRAARR